jgi:HEPN domain-containing protein
MELDELINKTKMFMEKGHYISCAIECGKIIELAYKYLLKKILGGHDSYHNLIRPINELINEKRIDYLTLGDLTRFFDKYKILSNLDEVKNNLSPNEINLLSSRLISDIRNKATHIWTSDRSKSAQSGAHIMYGVLLLLLRVGLIEEKKVAPSGNKRADLNLQPVSLKGIEENNVVEEEEKKETLIYQNKNSNQFFILHRPIDDLKAMLVTPKGDVKALELRLFEEPIEIKIEDILDDDRFPSIQRKKYDSLIKLGSGHGTTRERPPKGIIIRTGFQQPGKGPSLGKSPSKQVYPNGCTVDGMHFGHGSHAKDYLVNNGKVPYRDLPTCSTNWHKWLKDHQDQYGFRYKRDVY